MNRWRFRFEPRDCWIGVYFDKHGRIYFIAIPTLVFVYYRKSHWRIMRDGVPVYNHTITVK